MTQATVYSDRHAILAEIKRRWGSLQAMSRATGISASKVSAALGSPYPEVEKQIATAFGQPVQALWPDRYWPNGRRRYPNTRPQSSGASQNGAYPLDAGARE